MKVLFIGATGLVGSHVVPFLKDKFDLTLAALNSGNIAGLDVTAIDICNWELIESLIKNGTAGGAPFDAVVYCATANYRNDNQRDPESRHRYYENCIEVNARGAYHVFEAAWRGNVARVVHIGSMTAVVGYPRYENIDAESRDRPDDLYAATKIFGEHVGRSYVFRHCDELRPGGEDLPMKVLCLRLGHPFESTAHWTTHWIDSPYKESQLAVSMSDIALAIECALHTDVKYGVYPVVSAVEEPGVDPALYAELGYSPQCKFTANGMEKIPQI